MQYQIKIYSHKDDLPELTDKRFFHYASSFDWYRDISYYKPLMLVAYLNDKPVGAMFVLIMRLNRIFKASIFRRCYVSQPPVFYEKMEQSQQIILFNQMVKLLVEKIGRKVLYIEFRHLGNAVFGYKGFRENGFFSVKWINVCNSLQKKRNVWGQLSSTRKNQFNKARRAGVAVEELQSKEELPEIYKLIEQTRNWQFHHKFPPYEYFKNFFHYYISNGKGKILLTRYKGKVIGGIILGFEKEKVIVLYYWGKVKTYKSLYPTVFTIVSAMQMAEKEGYKYFDFMDSGYLNPKAGKPRFLLQFGGKPRATRRWYRFNWRLFNFFGKKIYD